MGIKASACRSVSRLKISGRGQSGEVATKKTESHPTPVTLTVPDVAEILGVQVTRVRRLIEDRYLLATRVDGVLRIPQDFLRDGNILSELHGTFILLHDVGFSDAEIYDWMFTVEDSLKTTPIEALRAGRKAEVRRIAQALL